MTYEIVYSDEAKDELKKYKKSNPMAYKKVYRLIDEIMEHPRTGTGKPEPLTGGNEITYSRRINKKCRLIYDIYDEKVFVLILTVDGHYDDK